MEFKAFDSISRINKLEMTITQKIHGTNAQVFIVELDEGKHDSLSAIKVDDKFYTIQAGSRNRWIYLGDDNHGFAGHVDRYKEEYIRLLGPGRHFGEWAGPGINSGEGLSEKTLLLFNHWQFPTDRPLPPQTAVVPVLYKGAFDLATIEAVADDLKTNGSKLVPGFKRPEGIVINVLGQRLKKVFEPEETAWTRPSGVKAVKVEGPDVSHLLQPIRLEKLLSRDESYIRNYPASIVTIVKDYVADLEKENQITGTEGEIKGIKKTLGKHLFSFVKSVISEKEAEKCNNL